MNLNQFGEPQKYRLGKQPPKEVNTEINKSGSMGVLLQGSHKSDSTFLGSHLSTDMTDQAMKIAEVLRIQMEVQNRLYEQLEAQKQLQQRMEERGIYLQSVLEKAQKALSEQGAVRSCADLECTRIELLDVASKVSKEGLIMSDLNTAADLSKLANGGNGHAKSSPPANNLQLPPSEFSQESCITSTHLLNETCINQYNSIKNKNMQLHGSQNASHRTLQADATPCEKGQELYAPNHDNVEQEGETDSATILLRKASNLAVFTKSREVSTENGGREEAHKLTSPPVNKRNAAFQDLLQACSREQKELSCSLGSLNYEHINTSYMDEDLEMNLGPPCTSTTSTAQVASSTALSFLPHHSSTHHGPLNTKKQSAVQLAVAHDLNLNLLENFRGTDLDVLGWAK